MKLPLIRLLLVLALPSLGAACHRPPAAPAALPPGPAASPAASPAEAGAREIAATPEPAAPPEFAVDAVDTREGIAAWYDVPARSLPARRAWPGEMTAASDTLPLSTYVRVRRIGPDGNGKSVVVRITDRGIHRKGTLIDLDRPAAETLDMIALGTARVRVETLALKHADADKPVGRKDATLAPAKITSVPAATREQEKDAAASKAGGATR